MLQARVKICGITRVEDAVAAAQLGADYIGLNLIAGPRKITIAQAREIAGAVKGSAQAVILTGDPSEDELKVAGIFQIYGEPPFRNLRSQPGALEWLVVHLEEDGIAETLTARIASMGALPEAIVADKKARGQLGGTGMPLDWTRLAEAWSLLAKRGAIPKLVLAGGLTPESVGEAVRIVRPYAVDVSSGVEVAGKPGVKDAIKMRDFIQAAKGA